jgi:hypothetical protein
MLGRAGKGRDVESSSSSGSSSSDGGRHVAKSDDGHVAFGASSAAATTDAGRMRVAAILAHTYGRKEAREAAQQMVAEYARHGVALHSVDKNVHGWLEEPPSRRLPRQA